MLSRPEVHQQVEDKLLARADELALRDVLPHADRMVHLVIDKIVPYGDRIRVLTCRGVKLPEDCMCQFGGRLPGNLGAQHQVAFTRVLNRQRAQS